MKTSYTIPLSVQALFSSMLVCLVNVIWRPLFVLLVWIVSIVLLQLINVMARFAFVGANRVVFLLYKCLANVYIFSPSTYRLVGLRHGFYHSDQLRFEIMGWHSYSSYSLRHSQLINKDYSYFSIDTGKIREIFNNSIRENENKKEPKAERLNSYTVGSDVLPKTERRWKVKEKT